MKKVLFLAVALMTLNGMASAALPPLWQNVAELKAILNDKQLGDTVQSGEVIEDIKKTETGWLIVTNHQEVPIQVVYAPATRPGPAQFTVVFPSAPK